MSRLDLEARMTIKTLNTKMTKSAIARLPETLPDPFDAVATRTVDIDCLVAFEGRLLISVEN
jgi:hypothetical protein